MAPLPTALLALLSKSQVATPSDFQAAAVQWANPTDVLTVLMIIGGDIVQRALASMAGSRGGFPLVPVAYSFGWVSYSFSAILSAIGDRRLLPAPDYDCVVVNARSGYHRRNRSFPLGRLLRDHEVRKQETGLVVEFFNTIPSKRAGYSSADWVYAFSIFIIASQLLLSILPIIIHQHYTIFILTLGGTILALLTAALPQWKEEKWAAREASPNTRSVVCLTAGNGSNYVMVIVSDGCGLKLEDLAAGRHNPSVWTSVAVIALAILWIVHLITVQGLTNDSWFSLAIGALGMVQNAVAAGAKRSCGALGFHLQRDDKRSFSAEKVFKALQIAEDTEPHVGLSLLPLFFPGQLRSDELIWRDARKAQLASEPPADNITSAAVCERASVDMERAIPCSEPATSPNRHSDAGLCAVHCGEIAPPPYARLAEHAATPLYTRTRDQGHIFPGFWRR
ncbi:hypothetical protein EIP86_008182 [Pleurotus ostreatoroseus]|nr:hypothetical protein EIP86_008182 [Pleurotus ostreatoroseus]